MDKNKAIELLKKQKLTEELMKDENFKKEAKEILKEEIPNVSDKDLKDILKETEKVISGNTEIKNEEDLDKVVGGSGVVKGITKTTIKALCTLGGAYAGKTAGLYVGVFSGLAIAEYDNKKHHPEYNRFEKFISGGILGISGGMVGMPVGGVVGGVCGYKLGKLICKVSGLDN